jgi:mannosylglycerate hydrolase
MQKPNTPVAFVVSHSHWDRAWYLPFEAYRHRLVRMMDRILDLLETNPTYSSFMFDGQTILIEDYLGVRPQAADRLKKLIEDKRLVIGPWYILPDLFLISGESVIRNLQAGLHDGHKWGNLLKVGYVPDPFGHFAQLPQILHQLELDTFMFMRGMPEEDFDRLGTIFSWEAPDGSTVLATYMIDGYFNASALGYPSIYGRFEGLKPDLNLAEERVRASIEIYSKHQQEPWFVLFNGMDHMPEQADLPEILHELKSKNLPFEIEHADLNTYNHLIRTSDRQFEHFKGDLDGNAHHPILKSVWSTRIYLKQENHRLESLITGTLEPLTLIACEQNLISYDQQLVDRVWRKLMKNHPHDDICGCSVDDVHFDNESRFKQVDHITEVIVTEILEKMLIQGINHPLNGTLSSNERCYVLVHNPHPYEITSWIDAELFFPNPEGENGAPPHLMPLEAFDGKGMKRELICLSSQAPVMKNQFLGGTWGRTYEVRIQATVPACGYTIIQCSYSKQELNLEKNITPKSTHSSWLKAILEWRPDYGDTYSYGPDSKNKVWEASAQLDPEQLHIQWQLSVDDESNSHKNLVVRGQIIPLDQGSDSIKLNYTNTLKNGRLRLLIPLEESVDSTIADAHFRLAEHHFKANRTPESDGERWNAYPGELDYGTQFMRDGVIIPRKNASSLWLASRGHHEYEIIQHSRYGSCLALTLHRSVGMLSVGGGRIRRVQAGPSVPVPGAQCLRDIVIALAMGTSTEPLSRIHRKIKEFSHPLKAYSLPWLPYVSPSGAFPAEESSLLIDNPAIVLSALKMHSDGRTWVIRIYSNSDTVQNTRLIVPKHKSYASTSSLTEVWNEDTVSNIRDGCITLQVPPHRIMTILVR